MKRAVGRIVSWRRAHVVIRPRSGPAVIADYAEINRASHGYLSVGSLVTYVAQPDPHGRPRMRAIDIRLEPSP